MTRLWRSRRTLAVPRDIGEYVYKAGATESNGLKLCNGQALLRASYAALDQEVYVGDARNATADFFYRCTDPANQNGSRDTAGAYIVMPDIQDRVPGGAGQGTFKVTFSNINVASNEIAVRSNESLYTGTSAVLSTTGSAPGGLTAGNTYYVIRVSSSSIKLAATRANAVAGTAIDITSQGAGSHTLTVTYTNREVGSVAGEEEHANTINETPAHKHTINDNYGVQDLEATFNNGNATDELSRTEDTSYTGGSEAHNNMQPTSFAGYWFIYAGVHQ